MDKGYEDIGFAKIDHDRENRQGYPEVIFGAGKTKEQTAEIFKRIVKNGSTAICTRANKEMAERCAISNTSSAIPDNILSRKNKLSTC